MCTYKYTGWGNEMVRFKESNKEFYSNHLHGNMEYKLKELRF